MPKPSKKPPGKAKSGHAPVDKKGQSPVITLRPVADLIPYVNNPRTHSDEQVAVIAGSIREFGWTNPVLIDGKSGIIAGHGRVLAARKLGLAEVPCIELAHLTAAQRRAYVIADNATALRAGWDDELLRLELGELEAVGFDLDLLGFDEKQLVSFMASVGGRGDPDDVPEPPENPVAMRGDLWVLGRHRLLCGDATNPDDVARVMCGATSPLMNTDPPYGVDYAAVKDGIPRSGFRDIQARGGDIENDDLTDGAALQAFLEAAIRAAVPFLNEDAAFYLWHPMLTQGTFFAAAAAAAAADILIHRQIIWVKPHLVLTRSGMYHWKHELCFYGWRRRYRPPWYGDKGQTSVWEIAHDGGDRHHPTQKPVALFDAPIKNHTKPGDVVYEPFTGSGSQIIAAEMTGRACYAIEIDPIYVDVAIQRWQNFTGQQATLDGKSFDEVKAERHRVLEPA